jgi:Ca-activated chloride channel homolog
VRRLIALSLLTWALLADRSASADSIWTDANIVTGLDFSGSIEPRDAHVQIDGMAMAIRSPQIIAAIKNGNHGRIGFAVFVWADGNYPILLTWRLIGSQADALAVAQEVSDQLNALLGSDTLVRLGALTDLSGALDYGSGMLDAAPFATNHRIVNIIGNGLDNVGEGARPARDRVVAQGITINAVALGQDRTIFNYFKRDVIGGPESFALMADDPEMLVEVLARKFVTEIVFNTSGVNPEGASQPLR